MTELLSDTELNMALLKIDTKVNLGLTTTHSAVGLLVLLLSWLNFQLPENGIALWLFKILPLLIFIPGFMKNHYRSYSWLCFVILPYFIWIIPMALYRKSWSDFLVVSLTVIIFIAAMMSSRWLQQQSYLKSQMA
jgi:uncharacterized membrane protein